MIQILDEILDKLNTIKRTSKTNAKKELAKEYLEDENFRVIIELALDGLLHYNINKLPPKQLHHTYPKSFDELVDFLHYLSGKQGATKQDKQDLADMCFTENCREVVLRILKKDLKCGMGGTLINKVEPGFINIMPYMRASGVKRIDQVRYKAIAQNKEDGLFVNIFPKELRVKYLSRNGNEFIFPENSLEKEILAYYPITKEPMVYMGEFRVMGVDGKWLPRKTSNGIVNQALKKNQSISLQNSLKVHFICWDAVPEKAFWLGVYKVPYIERYDTISFLNTLENLDSLGELDWPENNSKFSKNHLCKSEFVNSREEAIVFAKRMIKEDGDEGAILKDLQSDWGNKTHKRIIKLKDGALGEGKERECELRVIGFYAGKDGTKYQDCLGGLICESECKGLETNIGSGLSDEDRFFTGFDEDGEVINPDWDAAYDLIEEKYTGKVITVRFNEIIQDKKGSKPRLFLARYIELREDKNVADTVQYIEEL